MGVIRVFPFQYINIDILMIHRYPFSLNYHFMITAYKYYMYDLGLSYTITHT